MIGQLLKYFYREPDLVIGNNDSVYLKRWWLVPHNVLPFNVYLHRFLRSDDDRALHDHPWANISILLSGPYTEVMPRNRKEWMLKGNRDVIRKRRYPFIPVFRDANWIHRVELDKDKEGNEKPLWTLFITGKYRREWGFWCPFGFRHFLDFVVATDKGNRAGPGCD